MKNKWFMIILLFILNAMLIINIVNKNIYNYISYKYRYSLILVIIVLFLFIYSYYKEKNNQKMIYSNFIYCLPLFLIFMFNKDINNNTILMGNIGIKEIENESMYDKLNDELKNEKKYREDISKREKEEFKKITNNMLDESKIANEEKTNSFDYIKDIENNSDDEINEILEFTEELKKQENKLNNNSINEFKEKSNDKIKITKEVNDPIKDKFDDGIEEITEMDGTILDKPLNMYDDSINLNDLEDIKFQTEDILKNLKEIDGYLNINSVMYSEFYTNLFLNPKDYDGKKITTVLQILEKNIAGRYIMVCCAVDMLGYSIYVTDISDIPKGKFVRVYGTIKINEKGIPFIKTDKIINIKSPKIKYVY